MSLQDLVNAATARRHAFLSETAETLAHFAVEHLGLSEDDAAAMGNRLAEFICTQWSKQSIYFPADEAFKNSPRDWEIFMAMERGNAPEIARQHGLTVVRVYQIYKRCRAEMQRRTQPDLFSAESQNES